MSKLKKKPHPLKLTIKNNFRKKNIFFYTYITQSSSCSLRLDKKIKIK